MGDGVNKGWIWYAVLVPGIFQLLSFVVVGQSTDWQFSKEKNGVLVYTRPVEGFKIKEYKAIMEVDYSINQVSKVILDSSGFEEWLVDISKIQPAGTLPDGGVAVYMVIDTPFPVQDRDIVVVLKETESTDSLIKITTHAEPGLVEIQDDYIRMTFSSGLWLLEYIEGNRTRVTQTNLSDPGGTIPAWVINMMLTSNPLKTFNNLRDYLADRY
jgi:hypothetical protein